MLSFEIAFSYQICKGHCAQNYLFFAVINMFRGFTWKKFLKTYNALNV